MQGEREHMDNMQLQEVIILTYIIKKTTKWIYNIITFTASKRKEIAKTPSQKIYYCINIREDKIV